MRNSLAAVRTGGIWTGSMLLALAACSQEPSHPPVAGTGSTYGASSGAGSSGVGSSSGVPSGGSSGSGSSSGAAVDGGGGGSDASFAVSGTVSDLVTGDPLADASVCVLTSSACTTTDEAGAFSLPAVQADLSGFSAQAGGYTIGLWPLTLTGDAAAYPAMVRTTGLMTNLATEVGGSFGGNSLGALAFQVLDGAGKPRGGASVTAVQGTVGYVAESADGGVDLDPTLTATETSGAGYVFGLTPGRLVVAFEAAPLGDAGAGDGAAPVDAGLSACTRYGSDGWPALDGGTVMVTIKGDQLTSVRVVCP